MEKDAQKTKVLFVYPRYPDGQREVLALFPEYKSGYPGCNTSNGIMCYAHIGQHGTACKSFLRRARATKEQYEPLRLELEGIGYNLDILNRI